MHVSNLGRALLAAGLCSRITFASPAISRVLVAYLSETQSSTATPGLSTTDSAPTTSAASATSRVTTSASQNDPKPVGAYEKCTNPPADFAPFCTPTNGSVVYVGTTYYVTWESRSFGGTNASIYVMADYIDTKGGPIAFQSPVTSASTGFIAWTIAKEWLQDKSFNNITLYINPINPVSGEATRFSGPTVMVTNEPPDYYHQPPTEAPKGRDLYIALPAAFGFIILCVCGGCLINRKQRKIGLGNVMGRRKGYGAGKSRSQRLGLGKKNGDAILLREQELGSDGRYQDVPIDEERRGRTRERTGSADLGSLVESPTENRTNYFRDEMRRQEQQR